MTTDKRSGITRDLNRCSSSPRYIVDLIGRVVAVSVETQPIIGALPGLG